MGPARPPSRQRLMVWVSSSRVGTATRTWPLEAIRRAVATAMSVLPVPHAETAVTRRSPRSKAPVMAVRASC